MGIEALGANKSICEDGHTMNRSWKMRLCKSLWECNGLMEGKESAKSSCSHKTLVYEDPENMASLKSKQHEKKRLDRHNYRQGKGKKSHFLFKHLFISATFTVHLYEPDIVARSQNIYDSPKVPDCSK